MTRRKIMIYHKIKKFNKTIIFKSRLIEILSICELSTRTKQFSLILISTWFFNLKKLILFFFFFIIFVYRYEIPHGLSISTSRHTRWPRRTIKACSHIQYTKPQILSTLLKREACTSIPNYISWDIDIPIHFLSILTFLLNIFFSNFLIKIKSIQ